LWTGGDSAGAMTDNTGDVGAVTSGAAMDKTGGAWAGCVAWHAGGVAGRVGCGGWHRGHDGWRGRRNC